MLPGVPAASAAASDAGKVPRLSFLPWVRDVPSWPDSRGDRGGPRREPSVSTERLFAMTSQAASDQLGITVDDGDVSEALAKFARKKA